MDQAREHQGNQSNNDSNDNEKNNDATEVADTGSAGVIPPMIIRLPKPVLTLDPEIKYHAGKSVTQE
ncbi:unnamed protein product [Adineta steineri]|uniref:Uncharacterized protein n=1 Tax=Adineta steineri TaxID=433720 RepID=A0A815RFE9_9BILA|nr:unnamed protein product [Adineta steineri]CAF1475167.1 unnamed protein product [Adineta steineri]CAF3537523.1 unnamed protein product [Adineta steineri]CAF4024867.1 unnamed protein product [Adineta steineri]